MRLFLFLSLLSIFACKGPMDPAKMKNDAEQIAFDKCNMEIVTKRLEKLKLKYTVVLDSLKTPALDKANTIRLEFIKRQTFNKIEYYTEQKTAYERLTQEETKKYREEKYANEEDWKKLNELAEEKLKMKQPCESNAN